MRRSLAISLCLHAAILLWAVAVFPDADSLTSAQPVPVPVELVTPDEVSKVKAGTRKSAKEASARKQKPQPRKQAEVRRKKKAPLRKVARKRTPATPPEPAEPAPLPERVKSTAQAAPAPKAKADKTAAAPMPARKPKATKFTEPLKPKRHKHAVAKAEAKRKKKAFNPDDIAALLNKAPDARRERVAAVQETPKAPDKPARGVERGTALRMTLSEIDALRARISQCWNPPVGGLGAEALKVKLRLQLTREGMLARRPEVVNSGSSSFFQAAADSAVRAVMLCQPYALPSEKFALWRDMIINFDPREMFKG